MCGPASAQPNKMIVYWLPVCSKYDARTTCSKYKGGEDILEEKFSKIRSKYFSGAIIRWEAIKRVDCPWFQCQGGTCLHSNRQDSQRNCLSEEGSATISRGNYCMS